MSKKENPAPLEEREEAAETPQEITEELHQEAEEETFAVTREQMEKMEALAGQLAEAGD